MFDDQIEELKNFLRLFYRKEYTASLREWGDGPGARIRLKAWSYGGAREKAFRHFGCTDMIEVIVTEI